MRYFVTIDDQVFEVELGDKIRVNGTVLDAELLAVPGTPVRRLAIAGRSHPVHVATREGKGEWDFHLDGDRFMASVVDERTHAIRSMTGAAAKNTGPRPIKAPMPGLIKRIEVQPGETVSAGQGVIIIEAMKMENELKADAGGLVKRIAVQPGAAVEKGAILIEFEDVKV